MKKYILMLMLAFLPSVNALADGEGFDVLSWVAMVEDHKKIRTLLIARAAIEEGNSILHSHVNDTVKGYKEINVNLDKYTRCFNIIDVIIRGACTVVNTKNTYNIVKDRLTGINGLLREYADECLRHGDIETSDELIIKIGEGAINNVKGDVEDLLNSFGDLLLYSTGVGDCSTKRLMEIIENINNGLNAIKEHVTEAYVRLLSYVKARLSPFYNRRVFHSQNVAQMAQGALEKWLKNSQVLR